tara:strand:+ start:1250 stop:1447 length:198 start_codon:yes stop_codon:yes gene_type:complete
MNNRKLKFRTETGMTRFTFEQIAAITEKGDDSIEVHLCSGTIFTVFPEYGERFIDWFDYSQKVRA